MAPGPMLVVSMGLRRFERSPSVFSAPLAKSAASAYKRGHSTRVGRALGAEAILGAVKRPTGVSGFRRHVSHAEVQPVKE